MKYFISKHCQERYLERVLNGKNNVNNLLATIFNDLNNSKNIKLEKMLCQNLLEIL